MTKYAIHIMPETVDEWMKPPTTKPLFFMDKPEIAMPIKYKNRCYAVRLVHSQGENKYAYVKEFEFKEVDHEYTSEPICPYCGAEVSDAWEMDEHEEKEICNTCSSTFSCTREVIYEYSTEKVESCEPVEVEAE